LAIVLFALNFYICHELFWIEYTRHMGSIEGAFIGIARWAMHHWGDLTWFPLWYGGVPYQNTYPPLLHLCVAALATGAHTSAAHAYHFLTALAYLLGPLGLYALALRWSRSAWTAFSAALIYSTVSISAWILPEIRNDLGSALFPRRLQTLVYYGEGPHVASLLLLPLAILAVDAAISSRRARWFAIATILTAAILLTNWFGAVALVVAASCLLLAHFGSKGRVGTMIAVAAAIGVCAYLLAMPLAPPSTLKITFSSPSTLRGTAVQIYGSLPVRGVAVLAALGLTKFAIRKLSFALQFSILFTLVMTIFAVATHWDVNVIPQAARYHLEMEMGFALVIAFGGQAIFRTPRAATLAVALLLIGTIVPIRRDRNYARNFLLRSGDITSTIEWRTANWLNQHWSGGRVMPPGSVEFWMTAFSDIPLFGGGYQPGELEPVYPMAEYEIYSGAKAQGREAEVAVLWFKALGVEAAGVSGPRSTEYFRPFHNWRKYEGALEVLWRDGDNVLYRVQPPHSLARIVPKSALVAREPENGIDIDPLRPYVAALDDSSMPAASFTWTSAHSAKIRGSLADGQVISVQEAWHPGWRANVPMTHDALGQIVLKPSPGAFDVDLIFDGGAEMKIARACNVVTALGLVFALIVRRKR
jgi:hypothetical protein